MREVEERGRELTPRGVDDGVNGGVKGALGSARWGGGRAGVQGAGLAVHERIDAGWEREHSPPPRPYPLAGPS